MGGLCSDADDSSVDLRGNVYSEPTPATFQDIRKPRPPGFVELHSTLPRPFYPGLCTNHPAARADSSELSRLLFRPCLRGNRGEIGRLGPFVSRARVNGSNVRHVARRYRNSISTSSSLNPHISKQWEDYPGRRLGSYAYAWQDCSEPPSRRVPSTGYPVSRDSCITRAMENA